MKFAYLEPTASQTTNPQTQIPCEKVKVINWVSTKQIKFS